MAMMADDPIFIDTNVLVHAGVMESPFHRSALSAIQAREQSGVKLWISRQVLREYLVTLTRPQTYTHPVPISTLIPQIRSFENRFRVAEDGPQITEKLLALMEQIPTGGRQVHDANIVATMQAYGIRHLLTHNTDDFKRFSGLITLLPIEASV
jgi:predicted nucleic acid-binding protein